MGHIHTTSGEHDHTVSAYIVRLDFDEPKIMLHKHKKLGKFLQFGGHIELHENPWAALAHELEEESGYKLSQLRVLQPKLRLGQLLGIKVHPVPIIYNTHAFDESEEHYHTDAGYALVAHQDPELPPGEGESLHIHLFSLEDLDRLSSDEIYFNTREIARFLLKSSILEEFEQIPTLEYPL